MNKLVALGIAAALATGTACASSTSDAAVREIAAAQVHAHAVQQMPTVATAQVHLHHVINCLVGVNGAGYSAAAERVSGTPCKGLGHGAIADSAGDEPLHAALETALTDAQAGVHETQLNLVHADAAKAVAALHTAQRQVALRGAVVPKG